jgi:hypothetical protein
MPPIIQARMPSSSSDTTANDGSCIQLNAGELIISRTTLIVTLTICIFITCLSLLFLIALTYRAWAHKRELKAAKAWGRKSKYEHRCISIMRQRVDSEMSSK